MRTTVNTSSLLYCLILWLIAVGLWACTPSAVTENKNETTLHRAVSDGHLEKVTHLVSRGEKVTDVNRWEQTPLHLAAAGGHLDVVKYLVEQGADVNAKDSTGQTPLYWVASGKGKPEMIAYLVTQGAIPMMRDLHGSTPLHFALYSHYQNTNEGLAVIETFLNLGIPINAPDGHGETILHGTARMGGPCPGHQTETLKYVLARGAAINARNLEGNTPLHLAAKSLNTAGVAELVSQGADVQIRNNQGQTPLEMARGVNIGSFASEECRRVLVRTQRTQIEDLLAS